MRLPFGPARKRFKATGNLDHLPDILEECMQLVKENSIEGSKRTAVDIVYTPWGNLKKTALMDVGQVAFKDDKQVVRVKNVTRNRDIINRLRKFKKEEYPDLAKQKQEFEVKVLEKRKQRKKEQMKLKTEEIKRLRAEKEARDYKYLFLDEDKMKSNCNIESSEDASAAIKFEDSFM